MIKSKNNITFIHVLFIIATFTISFDIFMVIPIGFNFRFSQVLLLIIIFLFFLEILNYKKVILPLGTKNLLLWSYFIILFIPNTNFLVRNLGYAFWLIFNIMLIFSVVHFFSNVQRVVFLFKWYLYSFFFVSIFGIIQFVFPFLGISSPLLVDWWTVGSFIIPRINGFSYEPSYFSTYMLIGWILITYLKEKKSLLIPKKRLNIIFYTITLVMLLSSSRMGWIMMALWGARYFLVVIINAIKGEFKIFYFFITLRICIFFSMGVWFIKFFIGFEKIAFLTAGLGIVEGMGDHSAGVRFTQFKDTLTTFINSPIIGYSLGGVSEAIGKLRGINVSSLAEAKQNEGMSVFAQVLAASGFFGFIPFISYILIILLKPYKLARKLENRELKDIIFAMFWSLLYLLIILQFNQNILRPYVWLHIAILSAVYNVGKRYKESDSFEDNCN